MIKVICGKVGEGKTRECVMEIENAIDCRDIAILSKDGDFLNKIRHFGDIKTLNSKNITFYTLDTSIDNIIGGGKSYDMLVIDGFSESFDEVANQIPYDRFKKVIITQQLSRDFGRKSKTKPTFIGLCDVSSVYILDGIIIKNRHGALDDYSGVGKKISRFEKVVIQDGHGIDIYCKSEDVNLFENMVKHAKENNFSKGFFIQIHCQQ